MYPLFEDENSNHHHNPISNLARIHGMPVKVLNYSETINSFIQLMKSIDIFYFVFTIFCLLLFKL